MKIGILHLTDIHFSEKTDLSKKINSFARAIINDFVGTNRIYIVLSGDVAYSGKTIEYEIAWRFLSVVKQLVTAELKECDIKHIIVPGNHDCNFVQETHLRKNTVKGINYESIGDDSSVIDQCLTIQKEFWTFYNKYNETPKDKLYYRIMDTIGGKCIVFHCINTAWVSQLNEVPGSLFFPCKKVKLTNSLKGDINFGVWHHPSNWFNPNTIENNKAEYEIFIENLSSTHFFGHEHINTSHVKENADTEKKINLFSGEVFNDDKKNGKSGFQAFLIDLDSELGTRKVYSWQNDHYITNTSKEFILYKEEGKILTIKKEYLDSLVEIKIPLIIESKKDLKLTDIFVYQDLESTLKDNNKLENYFNSYKLFDNEYKFCILEGENQVGKTSLLSMLYIKFYERGFYPIFLKGKDIEDVNIEKYIKRAFKIQYSNQNDFDKYLQLPKSKKVILIDDFHDNGFKSQVSKKIFEELSQKYDKAFIIYDSANSLLASQKSDLKEIKTYTIKSLGYKKRNELIERYLSIKNNQLTYTENGLFDDVKELFDSVQTVLGDKLMPPYPIYILSIIQALQYKPLKNETSFGYCYQTLIHYSLHNAGVDNDQLDSYFNFLTVLAYDFLENGIDVKSNIDMANFYVKYSSKFISNSYEIILCNLKKSKLIKSDDLGISFCYSYILYYLSAKKISEILHTVQGKKILEKLFNNLHDEKNANVLVFVTHHSKDISFIESSLFSLMTALEKTRPITLEKNDPYYKDISSFVQEIKNDVLEAHRNQKNERERILHQNDERLRINEQKNDNDQNSIEEEEVTHIMMPIINSFRAIEIVGQIIKNRRGSLEINHLKDMIYELYTTAFRTINYYNDTLNTMKKDITNVISEKVDEGDTKREIEDRISGFIQYISFRMCLGVFNKLTDAAGNKDLKQLYKEVSEKINSPAAQIVTFGINLSYSKLDLKQLSTLVDELKDNIVALRLLKARVRGYVYNQNIDYAIKQKIASMLKMELSTTQFQLEKR